MTRPLPDRGWTGGLMKTVFHLSCILALLALLQGCSVYSAASDERLMDTMSLDNALSGVIKKDLMSERFADGWNISVHSYYGHVFLVGECPKELRAKAVEIAKRDKRVRSVTTHWFTPRPANTNNLVLATKLRSSLIATINLNSTRIDTEVNSDRVVLLGVANSSEERKTAVKSARGVNGVATVTSYIMLPMKPGTNFHPTGITYQGFNPPPKTAAKPAKADKKTDAKADKAAPKKAPASAPKKPEAIPDSPDDGSFPQDTGTGNYGDVENI